MASPDLVAAAADLHFAKTISGLRTVLSMGRLDAAVEATVRWDIEEVETTRAGFAVFQRRFLETNMVADNVASGSCSKRQRKIPCRR